MSKKKWTKETCYEAALKCTSRSDFCKKYPTAYNRALKELWLNEYTWFIHTAELLLKPKKWTKETCYEAALECISHSDFKKKYLGAYRRAIKECWISEYTWFIPTAELLSKPKKWTKETCYELALKCTSRIDYKKKYPGAYYKSLKMGWLKNYHWFKSTYEVLSEIERKYTYDVCKDEALKYTTLKEFREKSPNIYKASSKYSYLEDFDWLERVTSVYDIEDNVYAYIFEDLHAIYIGRTIDVIERDSVHHHNKSSVYRYAIEHNVDVPNMIVLETNITVREGLIKEDYYVNKYREEGWEIINKAKTGLHSGSIGLMGRKWTKNTCYEAALKCKTLKEFREKYQTAYCVALKNKWIDSYVWLKRIIDKHPKVVLQFTLDGQFIAKYNSSSEACQKYRFKYSGKIIDCCKRNRKTSYGFIWRYETDCEFEYTLDNESDNLT